MSSTRRVLTRRNAFLAGLATLVCAGGLLAACGKSGSSTGSTPAGDNGASGMQAYVACLSQNGVNIQLPSGRPCGGARPTDLPTGGVPPSGSGGFPGAGPSGAPGGGGFGGGFQKPDGVDDATWQKAQQACSSLRPTGRPGGQGGPGGQDDGAMSAYVNCLSNHGVTASAGAGALNSSDPTVAAAQKACAALLPTAAPSASSNG